MARSSVTRVDRSPTASNPALLYLCVVRRLRRLQAPPPAISAAIPCADRCISTTFTASRCSHVENAESPRKVQSCDRAGETPPGSDPPLRPRCPACAGIVNRPAACASHTASQTRGHRPRELCRSPPAPRQSEDCGAYVGCRSRLCRSGHQNKPFRGNCSMRKRSWGSAVVVFCAVRLIGKLSWEKAVWSSTQFRSAGVASGGTENARRNGKPRSGRPANRVRPRRIRRA